MIKENFILETFLSLTSRTYPYNSEHELINEFKFFPKDLKRDAHGNFYYRIGESKTMFTAHLDTSGHVKSKVNHVFDGNMIKTDGKTILGADDKAGVTIMLYMIKNKIPGLYYFFVGEEVGCIGSGLVARNFKDKYDRVISFDRRDTNSIITYQSFTRCCSDKFANALAHQINTKSNLKYKIDEGGIYTDSAEFVNIIPECTNLSVGYYKEHTCSESQNIEHLEKLASVCLRIDWENLPVVRNPLKTEYRNYTIYKDKSSRSYKKNYNRNYNSGYDNSRYSGYGNGYNWDDDDIDWTSDKKSRNNRFNKNKKNESVKTYYDGGDGKLIQITPAKSVVQDDKRNYYEAVADKILSGKITREEIEIYKSQFLDMTNENDKSFYKYLSDVAID